MKDIAKIALDYFQKIFTAGKCDRMDDCLNAVLYKITTKMHQFLTNEFSVDEVKAALFQMAPTKVPGPDEVFTSLLAKAELEGRIHGVAICRKAPMISHLLFADDSLLFYKASQKEVQVINELLQTYADASGQIINMKKSLVFFSNNTLVGMRDWIKAKLAGWKEKLLSKARKEVLIKAVAQSIPTYTMGVFQLPKKLCDDLNTMCANFWWGQVDRERKIHWQRWGILTQAKKYGGMGFRDLKIFNLAMLAKQGWRLLQNQESLVFKCLKARYFPCCSFMEAVDSPTSSYIWKSIMAAQPVLKKRCCWMVGDGTSIRVMSDSWIPNHPTNKILIHPVEEEWEWRVSDLMEPELRCWNREIIMSKFHKEDAKAILRIPLSRRLVVDSMVWLHTARGVYSVKSGYYVATQVLRGADWIESSRGLSGTKVWALLWKLKVPNKIKIFGWRCGVARDVQASSLVKLQKCGGGQWDSMQLFKEMQDRLSREELELYLVQAGLIWTQQNRILHGGKLQSPTQLNKRAFDLLAEFRQAQEQLTIVSRTSTESRWCPPPISRFKLNFDVAIFPDLKCSSLGAIIHNENGEVMGAMSAKGPQVQDSIEVEVLACRRALEFAIDIGFFRWIEVKLVKRDANGVAHSLARFVKTIVEDIFWLEDSPPPALEALYVDSLQFQ
nr:uncharacterized protein LOC112006735 [Quercus suber]